jgi:hypothetical protein
VTGELIIKVEGLVLDPNDPVVIERGLAGDNPVAQFKAMLSCLTVVPSMNTTEVVNLMTSLVPASIGGDAEIREVLTNIPNPCIAPIVFVTSPGGSWFAASGF